MKIEVWLIVYTFLLGSSALYAMEQSSSPMMGCSSGGLVANEDTKFPCKIAVEEQDPKACLGCFVQQLYMRAEGCPSPLAENFCESWKDAKQKEEERRLSTQTFPVETKRQCLIRTLEEANLIPYDLSDLVDVETKLKIRLAVCQDIEKNCRILVQLGHEKQKLHMQVYLYEQLAKHPEYFFNEDTRKSHAFSAWFLKQHPSYDADPAVCRSYEQCAEKLIAFFSQKRLHKEGAKKMQLWAQLFAK